MRAEHIGDDQSLWALIEKLFSVGNLLDFYWSANAGAQVDEMKALAAAGSLVHVPTYLAVLRDFLARKPAAHPTFSGPGMYGLGATIRIRGLMTQAFGGRCFPSVGRIGGSGAFSAFGVAGGGLDAGGLKANPFNNNQERKPGLYHPGG